ncbi:hypothetical protein PG984_001181 [Apiospora sp. TS-2023a]
MSDNGDQQRQRGSIGAPRGSKLPLKGSGSRRNDTSHRRTDSETTGSPQQSGEAKPRLSNEATSLQAARRSFEAAAENSPKVAKLTKKSAPKADRAERVASTGEAPKNETKRRIEQQSRLPRSPETTSTAAFAERSRVDTPSRNPHSLELGRQSKIPSPSTTSETRTHRRAPSSASVASVASVVSSMDVSSSLYLQHLTLCR